MKIMTTNASVSHKGNSTAELTPRHWISYFMRQTALSVEKALVLFYHLWAMAGFAVLVVASAALFVVDSFTGIRRLWAGFAVLVVASAAALIRRAVEEVYKEYAYFQKLFAEANDVVTRYRSESGYVANCGGALGSVDYFLMFGELLVVAVRDLFFDLLLVGGILLGVFCYISFD